MEANQVKIGWKTYNAVAVEDLKNENEDKLYGQIEYSDLEIRIDPQYSKEQQEATMLHEIVHGLNDMYALGIDEDNTVRLANGLYLLFKENPHIFRLDQPQLAKPVIQEPKKGC